MAVKNKRNKNKNHAAENKSPRGESFFSRFALPEESKKWSGGIIVFLIAIIVSLSFFEKAGIAGEFIFKILSLLVGKVIFLLPLVLVLAGFVFFFTQYKKFFWPLLLAGFLLVIGISGIAHSFSPASREGGWLGYLVALPLLEFFGDLVAKIIFVGIISIGGLIFWHLLKQPVQRDALGEEVKKEPSLIRKFFTPKFEVKEIPHTSQIPKDAKAQKEGMLEPKAKMASAASSLDEYPVPPLELLDPDKGQPTAGDVRQNSAIIKKTLESFEIPVEMSEVNIGPTVTQYTLKPADGIKLSKITTLSNDLALALASHPIRIEAPVPGKSLVGIEVPNKGRTIVRLRYLMQHPLFQNANSNLTLCMGRDVSGTPVFTDLARMPHLLVAGATGTGKTIFLNDLLISLIYRNSPKFLKFILVDPKRVELTVYNDLPHLLTPVIYDAQKTVNALNWLTGEMERRFEIMAQQKARDIIGYNAIANKTHEVETMPYIVVMIDELADLMAARGRDIEARIVRLAQMARAVGIHLIVATQRPSVEVITGLIKANITSRVTFQVASQVDSRTVIDTAGAEKLLGAGDLLYISADVVKPKRVQGPYISEKEVKRVVNWIKSKTQKVNEESPLQEEIENGLSKELEKNLELPEGDMRGGGAFDNDDPLLEEAKRVVTEAKKASASLLQRRLRIGYARAARLLDFLEEGNVIGPADGSKPREILVHAENRDFPAEGLAKNDTKEKKEDEDGWQKI